MSSDIILLRITLSLPVGDRKEACKSNLIGVASPVEIRELPIAAVRLRRSLDDVLVTFCKFGRALARELELATKLVKEVTLTCGIAILSDDLLANIFEIVVLGGSERNGRSALKLSQVCRRFRCVALETSSIWSSIRAGANSGILTRTRNATYLKRSKVSPLDIVFNVVHSKKNVGVGLSRFMNDALPLAPRWRQFHLELNSSKLGVSQVCDALTKLSTVHLPNLERLGIFMNFYIHSWFVENLTPFAHWNAPNLRALELRDFAIDLRNFSSLTEVSVSIYSGMFPFKLFFDNLESLRSLRALHIGLHCAHSTMGSKQLTLPSVSNLSFAILIKDDAPHHEILAWLVCPNVAHFSIELLVNSNGSVITRATKGYSSTTEEVIALHIAQLFARQRYEHLTHLRLKVKVPKTYLAGAGAFGYAINRTPLSFLPRLQHLTLEGTLSGPGTILELPERGTFPALKTITIQSPRPDKLYEWLAKVVERLTAHGHWEHFEQLVIRKEDERGTVVERKIIPRDPVEERPEPTSSDALKNLLNYFANKYFPNNATNRL